MAYITLAQWFDRFKSSFASYPEYVFEIIFYGPLGLILGFISKVLGKLLLFALLIIGLFLLVAQAFDVVIIKLPDIWSFIGLDSVHNLHELFLFLYQWARTHITGVISLILGFFIGWKLG